MVIQGCDDILALLLAFASKPEDIEVLLISVTYGNVEAQRCVTIKSIHRSVIIGCDDADIGHFI